MIPHRPLVSDLTLAAILGVAVLALLLLAPTEAVARAPDQPTPTTTPVLPSPPPTPTLPGPSATPPPLPTPPGPTVRVCKQIVNRVPAVDLNAALANPGRIGGYNQLRVPGKPASPHNQPRLMLSILAYSKPYHPTYNGLTFKVGCP